MGFSAVHPVYRINGLASFRLALSTHVYRRGSLDGSLGRSTARCATTLELLRADNFRMGVAVWNFVERETGTGSADLVFVLGFFKRKRL